MPVEFPMSLIWFRRNRFQCQRWSMVYQLNIEWMNIWERLSYNAQKPSWMIIPPQIKFPPNCCERKPAWNDQPVIKFVGTWTVCGTELRKRCILSEIFPFPRSRDHYEQNFSRRCGPTLSCIGSTDQRPFSSPTKISNNAVFPKLGKVTWFMTEVPENSSQIWEWCPVSLDSIHPLETTIIPLKELKRMIFHPAIP